MGYPVRRLNFDRNATWGLLPEVGESLLPQLNDALNPSSRHSAGQRARALIEESRDRVRNLFGEDGALEVVFCSGATEANNTAIFSAAGGLTSSRRGSIVVSAIEHPSVLEAAKLLQRRGHELRYALPLRDERGIDLDVEKVVTADTVLFSCMLANNETGDILPVRRIFERVRALAPDALCHCDAVQGVGKIAFGWHDLGADLVSISGHKIGALPGVGALLFRKGLSLAPLMVGGPQETRQRAGTENVPGIVSFGAVAEVVSRSLPQRITAMRRAQGCLWQELQHIPQIRLTSHLSGGLPNTLNVLLPGVAADDLVVALDLQGIFVSSGSACASGKSDPSHVLLALGLSEAEARASIRISVSGEESEAELRDAGASIAATVARMRSIRGGRDVSPLQ